MVFLGRHLRAYVLTASARDSDKCFVVNCFISGCSAAVISVSAVCLSCPNSVFSFWDPGPEYITVQLSPNIGATRTQVWGWRFSSPQTQRRGSELWWALPVSVGWVTGSSEVEGWWWKGASGLGWGFSPPGTVLGPRSWSLRESRTREWRQNKSAQSDFPTGMEHGRWISRYRGDMTPGRHDTTGERSLFPCRRILFLNMASHSTVMESHLALCQDSDFELSYFTRDV